MSIHFPNLLILYPQPYSEEKFSEKLVEAMRKAGIDERYIKAYKKTGLIVTEDNVDLKSRLIHVTHTKNWVCAKCPHESKIDKSSKKYYKKIIAVPMYLLVGQEDQIGLKGFRFHDLRHTWCSRMCELGVSLL